MKRNAWIPSILLLLALTLSCKSGPREDPILRLSAQEALQEGKTFLEAKKYYKARRLLTHAFEVEPNSRGGREALLLAADAIYLDGGGPDNFIKCEAKYRDFLNRFPTSDRSDYAQFQVANCLFARMEKPDRDQKASLEAMKAYEELLRLYPTSSHAGEARAKIIEVNNHLGEYELGVGIFYRRFRNCNGSIQRLELVRESFPDLSKMDEALFNISLAYRLCAKDEEADAAYRELVERFPQSPFLAEYEKANRKTLKLLEKGKRRMAKRMKG